MNILDVVLTIGGTSYDAPTRGQNDLMLDSWGWDYDSGNRCEFHEMAPGPTPRWHGEQAVTLMINGVQRFNGLITEVQPTFTPDGWTFGYKCEGLKYKMNRIPVTAMDGSGTMMFNLPPTERDYYTPSLAGLTVGSILSNVLIQHSAQLTAAGITTDATTNTQLAAMTLVPPEPIYVAGERLANALETVLRRWARNIVLYIDGTGLLRFYDTTAGTVLTLTEGVDPIEPIRFGRSLTDCATRVVARGRGKIFPTYVSLLKTTLQKSWTPAQETAWTYKDFSQPNDAYDKGTVVSIDSPTTVTVQSSDATKGWAANFWNGRQAWIYLHSGSGTALVYTESRPVTANAAWAAGGTAQLTLAFDLENAGINAYSTYELIGTVAGVASTDVSNRNEVWRRYHVVTPGNWIEQHLVPKFPSPVPFANYSGSSEELVLFPVASIIRGLVSWPASFKIDPKAGDIIFDEPVVKSLNSQSTLDSGSGLTTPDDLYVLLAYSRGALTAAYPPNDASGNPTYGGSAFTGPENLQLTYTVDIDSWQYAGNTSQMQSYAQMIWQSMCDTVLTGNVIHKDAYTAAFDPGKVLNIAADTYITGYEAARVPIRGLSLQFHSDGAGQLYTTTLKCSTRRNPMTGDRYYVHPTRLDQAMFKMNLGGQFGDAMLALQYILPPPNQGMAITPAAMMPDINMAGMAPNMGSLAPNLGSFAPDYRSETPNYETQQQEPEETKEPRRYE
jgi:hypothetical protein